ncbi:Predicted Peptidoglycan domain-containing protein [Noviherbaspirillum humi]|uniref:Predicted Peptidoglycan domain-containing protein n=1 Tax=Noviherbaspirillum humi TaxID=1688639 RepID=A0A239LHC8_9BURK|nr:glycosyl hydrolase 108 family protein [Noviherbaspirillum humi]SNT29298.1 Predicted Peptidoglycan domain-containing protein [Noviherbaspirillum humi]
MSFDQAFEQLIGNEGRYSDNPKDPGNWSGGKVGVGTLDGTMWGVSAPVARAWGYKGRMQDLPLNMAKAIAKTKYWDVYQCDQFDDRIAFQVIDAAYNGGYPAKWLQQAAGVTVDGVIGAQTVKAVRSTDPMKIIMRFDAYRLKYMKDCQIWPDVSRGWVDRIANNLLLGAA